MRSLAATGFGLVVIMQIIFIATAGDRPFPYQEVQIVSLFGTLALIVGVVRRLDVSLTAGFAVIALGRIAQIAFGLSRLPVLLNVALAAGWIWATIVASRGRTPRAAVWFLAVVHLASMFWVLGRFNAAIALALGAAGLFLAAPNLGLDRKHIVRR